MDALYWALGGTGFICLLTTLGSATVLFFRKGASRNLQSIFLGFAAGVMIAASVWSLLIPAREESESNGQPGWIPAAAGFIIGVLFLLGLDKVIPHLHPFAGVQEGMSSSLKRTTLLVSAVTLHNIPEGMAVGLSFALAAQHPGDASIFASAVALAMGIGIQDFPEGAAISLPLHQEGMSRWKSFFIGSMSGVVEMVFGMLTVLIASAVAPYMPWLLSFAAGAMMYVVIEELIPEAHLGEHSGIGTNVGTIGVLTGFLIMMVLDVALG